jgi:HK97 gp10 family phage protein
VAQQVKGLTQLLKDLQNFGEDGARYSVAITNATAETIVNEAKLRAPVNLGQLRQSIGKTTARVKPIVYNISYVFANAPYAPYINWGTGGLVQVTSEFAEYAMTFKGAGIKKINIPATGFLTIPYAENAKIYPKDLEKAFNKLTKQYNNKK